RGQSTDRRTRADGVPLDSEHGITVDRRLRSERLVVERLGEDKCVLGTCTSDGGRPLELAKDTDAHAGLLPDLAYGGVLDRFTVLDAATGQQPEERTVVPAVLHEQQQVPAQTDDAHPLVRRVATVGHNGQCAA